MKPNMDFKKILKEELKKQNERKERRLVFRSPEFKKERFIEFMTGYVCGIFAGIFIALVLGYL